MPPRLVAVALLLTAIVLLISTTETPVGGLADALVAGYEWVTEPVDALKRTLGLWIGLVIMTIMSVGGVLIFFALALERELASLTLLLLFEAAVLSGLGSITADFGWTPSPLDILRDAYRSFATQLPP